MAQFEHMNYLMYLSHNLNMDMDMDMEHFSGQIKA